MKILRLERNFEQFIIKELQKNNIFVIATDTSYGIIGKISPEVIQRIFKIKKRLKEKSIPIFVNKKIVQELAVPNEKARILMKKFWPGDLTIILKAKPEKVSFLRPVLGPDNTIAIREPDNKLILDVLRKIKEPLTATSANISAKPPAYKSKEVLDYFSINPSPDYFIDFGNLPKKPVSTIIDLTDDLKILRTGEIKEKEIKEVLKVNN